MDYKLIKKNLLQNVKKLKSTVYEHTKLHFEISNWKFELKCIRIKDRSTFKSTTSSFNFSDFLKYRSEQNFHDKHTDLGSFFEWHANANHFALMRIIPDYTERVPNRIHQKRLIRVELIYRHKEKK